MENTKTKRAEAQMLIRKGVNEVFNAFIDPEQTKQFWFTKGSDKLQLGKEITWTWEMYNFSAKVMATEIVLDKKIQFNWFAAGQHPTIVDIGFKVLSDKATYVAISHYGFDQTENELTAALIDSSCGFTMVLAGLKSYLEHGINLNLVADKSPKDLRDT